MVDIKLVRSITEEMRSAAAHLEAADPDAPPWEAEQRARRARALLAIVLGLPQIPGEGSAHEVEAIHPSGPRGERIAR